MRRFSFRLEKVLELRTYQERTWELKLAEVTGRVLSVEGELRQWELRRRSVEFVPTPEGPVDMDLLRSREGYMRHAGERAAELERRLEALEVERDKVRSGYLEASRKRKALSRLKERRAEEYYHRALGEEGRSLDEIGSSLATGRVRAAEEEHV